MNEFPFPPELSSAPIDLLMHVVKMDPPVLVDDVDENLKWSRAIRDFLRLWFVSCPQTPPPPFPSYAERFYVSLSPSLEKDPKVRPPPQTLLNHPWIKKSEQRQPDLAKWLAQVWGWDEHH
jgi:mitogen-activated protein kinase kinase